MRDGDLETDAEVLILGIGNILWADEGFGVRAVELLHRSYRFPDTVRLMDGGTQGLYLVQYVKTAKRLLVFDAIDYGETPGTLKIVWNDAVPSFTGCRKLSLHQTGFQEVLAAAALLGGGPAELALIGVQAENLEDWGGSLRASVRDCLEPALGHALDILRGWGIVAELRPVPLGDDEGLLGHRLDLAGYERRNEVPS